MILRYNPYAVLEGARSQPTRSVPLGRRCGEGDVHPRTGPAQRRDRRAGAGGAVDRGVITVFAGPREYLYGEETALLEAIAGRPPFPRIAPPWRRGVTEVVATAADATSESGLAAPVEMVGTTEAPPTLVNNVETDRQRPLDPRQRRGMVPRLRFRGVAGDHRVHGQRVDATGGRRGGRDGYPHPRGGHRARRRRPRRTADRRDPVRRRQRRAERRRSSTRRCLTRR